MAGVGLLVLLVQSVVYVVVEDLEPAASTAAVEYGTPTLQTGRASAFAGRRRGR